MGSLYRNSSDVSVLLSFFLRATFNMLTAASLARCETTLTLFLRMISGRRVLLKPKRMLNQLGRDRQAGVDCEITTDMMMMWVGSCSLLTSLLHNRISLQLDTTAPEEVLYSGSGVMYTFNFSVFYSSISPKKLNTRKAALRICCNKRPG